VLKVGIYSPQIYIKFIAAVKEVMVMSQGNT